MKKIITGTDISKAKKALIMIHGRGGSAADISGLAAYLALEDFVIIAPEADGNSWYPNSFLANPAQNEPYLSKALSVLEEIVSDLESKGISSDRTFILGFSQGACLSLEFATRKARRWGGVIAFTGGLIGDQLYPDNYSGDFGQTPIFIGTGNPDPHVPVSRVEESAALLEKMNAKLLMKTYNGIGHTIVDDEIEQANTILAA